MAGTPRGARIPQKSQQHREAWYEDRCHWRRGCRDQGRRAKLKREQPGAEVVLYSKGRDISYAGCGLPYYLGGGIPTRDALIVNTPQKFAGLTGVQVFTGQEATGIDPPPKP